MDNNLTLERFCIWEEKNSIEPEKKYESNGNNNPNDTIINIEKKSAKNECENTGKKMCNKCKSLKDFSSFYKNKEVRDGYHRWCKECMKKYMEVWKPTDEMIKKYRKRVRERYKERMKIEYYKIKEKLRKEKNRKTDEYREYQR